MDFNTLDAIISEGRELGSYLFIYSGVEPLIRKNEILKLCEKYDDCLFLALTNGNLISKKTAEELRRVKNLIPVINIESVKTEEVVDNYQTCCHAMDILRERKLLFGFSVCYNSKNTELFGSKIFINEMIKKGAKFGFFLNYMPVGCGAKTELITSAGQREYMVSKLRKFRDSKPLFTIDFCNDSEYVGGCIGGRRIIHIGGNGDIGPCPFIRYSDSNIREKTLLEAFKSPFLTEFRKNQPFSKNHLRPCPLLDSPEKLPEMVRKTGAVSSDLSRPEDASVVSAKCRVAAKNWEILAEKYWQAASLKAAKIFSKIYNYENFARFL